MKLKQTFSNHPSGKYSSLLSKINTSIFLPKFCNFNNSYINDYYLGVFTSLITIQQYIIIKVFICKNGSSHRRCSVKKGVLRSFTKFAGKYVCQSLFLIKVQALACNIIRLWQRCFPVNFTKFLTTLFLQNTSGRLFP